MSKVLGIFQLLLFFILVNNLLAQDLTRKTVDVPKVDPTLITIDGQMDEAAWGNAAEVNIITATGYEIWANKYYREDLSEPEFDELYGRLLYSNDTLYVFMHIDEFVNDSTGLFFNGKWAGDQLFISLSSRLGTEMNGWYDGNSYAAPEGPYHFWVLGDNVTLNGGDTTYIDENYRKCVDDSMMVLDPAQNARWAVHLDEATGVWDVEMAIYNPHIAPQSRISFNVGGSNGSAVAFAQFEDAYQYWTWQPNIPNDPWAIPAENDPGYYNLASSSQWALLNFIPDQEDLARKEVTVPPVDPALISIDGQMNESAWEDAAEINVITATGYEIWANKYYREDLSEPEFDELSGKLLYADDTLYVFMHIDEFVNDSTGLFFNGKWAGDQLFISLSNRLGVEMNGWYDGNSYAAPEGPFHFWVLGDNVTLNGGDTTYIDEKYRGCIGDSMLVLDPSEFARWAVHLDEATGVWDVEMAIYNPGVAYGAKLGFNVGGSNGSEAAFAQFEDAYQYWTWQPNVPNDPWAIPAENDPGFYNLASASHWAVLTFGSDLTSIDDEKTISTIPADFSLEQNYPNPFNPTTTIKFNLSEAGKVSLKVYNVLGQVVETLVNNKEYAPGTYSLQWNADKNSSGIYFYELRNGNNVITRKMVLLK